MTSLQKGKNREIYVSNHLKSYRANCSKSPERDFLQSGHQLEGAQPYCHRLSWDILMSRIVNDLKTYLKCRTPDLVIYSGSKGGAVCGGIAFSNVIEPLAKENKKQIPTLLLIDTLDVEKIRHEHEFISGAKLDYFRTLVNQSRIILLIESTRQPGSPYIFIERMLKDGNSGAILLDYAVVWVEYSNDPERQPSAFSFKTDVLMSDRFRFPWCL